MNKTKLNKVAKTFEQEDYNIPQCLGYFVGVDGPTVESIEHPDHLWTILDRLETIVMDNESGNLNDDQKEFLLHFIGKWMTEIERYCVRLESE